ncbi:MAG: hypothetical protein UH080_01765 [Ruminococcus sp.]|nr:hypothetical protein [Ruminococcus sp.]
MFKKKLFGSNIKPNCAYCRNSRYEKGIYFCNKDHSIKNDKCRSFKYDPLMRVPMSISLKKDFKADDFRL